MTRMALSWRSFVLREGRVCRRWACRFWCGRGRGDKGGFRRFLRFYSGEGVCVCRIMKLVGKVDGVRDEIVVCIVWMVVVGYGWGCEEESFRYVGSNPSFAPRKLDWLLSNG